MLTTFKFKSIKNRLTFWMLSLMVIIILIRATYTMSIQINKAENALNSDLEMFLTLGTSALQTALWDLNESNMNDVLNMLIDDPKLIQVTIKNDKGDILLQKVKDDAKRELYDTLKNDKEIVYNKQIIGHLEIVISDKVYQLELESNLYKELFFAILTLCLITLMINLVSVRTTTPIIKLAMIAERIEEGDYEAQFFTVSNDEVGRLGQSLKSMKDQLQQQIWTLENDHVKIDTLYRESARSNTELSRTLEMVNQNYEDTLRALANAIEANDQYTKGHCERVREYALLMADKLSIEETQIIELSRAALLHDIGKIGIPSNILNKEQPLTHDEYDRIKRHSEIGAQILSEVNFLEACIPIIEQHHERFDGKGYPNGLSGTEIHLGARILSIADAFDAMTSSRAYRKTPLTFDSAIDEINKYSGYQFDPELVKIFTECIKSKEGDI